MRARRFLPVWTTVSLALLLACGSGEPGDAPSAAKQAAPPAEPGAAAQAPATPVDLPTGLMLAISEFGRTADGKVKTLPARLAFLVRQGGSWHYSVHDDPESNVFHKAMVYGGGGAPGILTLGGTKAMLKLWRLEGTSFQAQTLWEKDFGGKWSRMRDVETGDLFGDGRETLAVATHDQGVVAVVRPGDAGFEVQELDARPDTIVHEVEIGDLDGDGVLEVYATPSEPNRLDGTPQHGQVVRYVPAKGEGPDVVADLGERHAKEILVSDVDGDGRDELYVVIEAVEGGSLEIRRYDADTDGAAGASVASLEDSMCRFLTSGDVDGDGRRELVAAAKDSGLWLLRPGADPGTSWSKSSIDRDSKGFEHAALLADLDGDGTDELYAASDDHGEVRRYVWTGEGFAREVIHARPKGGGQALTWNIMPVPVDLVP